MPLFWVDKLVTTSVVSMVFLRGEDLMYSIKKDKKPEINECGTALTSLRGFAGGCE